MRNYQFKIKTINSSGEIKTKNIHAYAASVAEAWSAVHTTLDDGQYHYGGGQVVSIEMVFEVRTEVIFG